MKKSTLFGVCIGFTLGAAAAVAGAMAVRKIAGEIKEDIDEVTFASPNADNTVTLSFGSSETAKGLTVIKVKAISETKMDTCDLVVLAKKKADLLHGEWADNEHFKLLIGGGKRKQCCDVSFAGDKITAKYYLVKKDATPTVEITEPEAVPEVEKEVVEVEEAEAAEVAEA